MRRRRALLVALLILLALLACGLGAFYVWIGQPAKSAAPAEIPGLTHERSIYPPEGASSFKFSYPSRLALTADGNLLVSDPRAKDVFVISQSGTVLSKLKPKTKFITPTGVGVWADGTMWVADWPASQLVVFNSAGVETRRFRQEFPLSINIVGKKAYVSSPGTIYVYNQSGTILTMFGRGRGPGSGQVDMPHGVVPAGNDIVISDSLNSRVMRMGAGSKVVWSVGYRKKGMNNAPTGPYNLPSDAVIGQKGFLFVVDRFNNEILIVDAKNGKIVRTVGQRGAKDGEFNYPDGLTYLGDDRYALADGGNARIQILRIALPGATTSAGVGDLLKTIGPGDVGVLLLWCAVPLGVLLIALLIFLALRGRRRASEEPSGENPVTDVTQEDEEG